MNNKAVQVIKYILLICSMYICVLFGILCYSAGFAINILITLTAVILSYIGYKYTRKIIDLSFLYINLLLSIYIGSKYATSLYYNNISSDNMTLIVGDIFLYVSLTVALLCIIIFTAIRIMEIRKSKNQK